MAIAAPFNTADEFVQVSLSELGAGRRSLVFVFDPELLLNWPEDADASVSDSADAVWRVLSYRGNDLALRARFQPGRRTVIWVRPAPGDGARQIDVTTLADIVATADAHLDASLAGMVAAILPDVPLPEELAAWAPQATKQPAQFARALERVLREHAAPVSKRHILAAALCAGSRPVTPVAAWLNDTSLSSCTAAYMHVLALDSTLTVRAAAAEQLRHVASLVHGGSREAVAALLQAPPEALLHLAYALAATQRHTVVNAPAALINHGLAADATPLLAGWPELMLETADHLNSQEDVLRTVCQEVEKRLAPARVRQLQAVLARAAPHWAAERIAGVRLALLASVVDEGGQLPQQLDADVVPPVGAPKMVRGADALVRLARTLARSVGSPDGNSGERSLDDLVAWYAEDLAMLEYDAGEARRDLQVVAAVLGEQPKLTARLAERQTAIGDCLDGANRRLAQILRLDPLAVARSPLALHRWLPADIVPRLQATEGRRLWLLIFDGLRWDLWERVLRPELAALGWAPTVHAGLACLPSETSFSRRALLAGKSPSLWLSDNPPTEEHLLRACLAGRGTEESDLVYRLKAERGDDVASPAAPGRINVWVYRTPDRLVHQADGSLRDAAAQFRTFLRDNVLPELADAVTADDLVFVGADHGFLAVAPVNVTVVMGPAELVHDRYVESNLPPAGTSVEVRYGERRFHVATGDTLFRDLEAKTPSAGFRHGGATLQELVVPLVELRLLVRRTGALQMVLTGPARLEEDTAAEFVVRLSNDSEEAVRGQLFFETNQGRLIAMPMQVQPGATAERRCPVKAEEGLAWVRVRLASGAANLASATQRVAVALKPGIKISGLDKLDEF